MNDTPTGAGPSRPASPEMLQAVQTGEKLLGEVEANLKALAVLCNTGEKIGMMDLCERDELANEALSLRHRVLAYHARLTKIAKRNNADGALQRGGPGR